MARIIPLQPKISFQQTPTKLGNFYPACIYANPEFFERFENSLIVSKSLLADDSEHHEIVGRMLQSLSDYSIHKKSITSELPTEIEQHFCLLPDLDASIDMAFEAANNIPTEVMLFSLEEISAFSNVFDEAISKAAPDQYEIISPMQIGFSSFLNDWIANSDQTGSLFASQN